MFLLWGVIPNTASMDSGHFETRDPYTLTSVTGSLRITNNSHLESLAVAKGWMGDGSVSDPYIIQDLDIDARGRGSAIHIGNTTHHMILRNSNLYNASMEPGIWWPGAAVTLHGASNVTILDNTISGSRYGILLVSSHGNTISKNRLTGNTYHGLELRSSSHNSIIENIFHGASGSLVSSSPFNSFYGNEFANRGVIISGGRETYTQQNIASNNTVRDKPIVYYSNIFGAGLAVPPDAGQVILANVTSIRIQDLSISGSTVTIAYSEDVEVTGNRISQNPGLSGLHIRYSKDIHVIGNILRENQNGIFLFSTSSSLVKENEIRNNIEDGVYLGGGSYENTVTDNILDRCGVLLHSTHDNLITNNVIYRNPVGGLILSSGTHGNLIHSNAFIYNNRALDHYNENRIQATDTTGNNRWNTSTGKGNYWRDWTVPDEDSDGVVDYPYRISGSDTYDHHPRVEPAMPVIPYSPEELELVIGNGHLTLNWTKPRENQFSMVTGYNIYRGKTPTTLAHVATVTDDLNTMYTDSEVINEETYHYLVNAFNEVGESLPTEIISGSPDGLPPVLEFFEPLNNTHTNLVDITVNWYRIDTNSGLDRSEIRLNDGDWVDVGLETRYEFIDLEEGEHRIWIRVFDNAGNVNMRWRRVFVDLTAPSVVDHGPLGDDVPRDTEIFVVFSEPMDERSVFISSFEGPVDIIEWINGTTLIARANFPIEYRQMYTIFLDGADLAGNSMDTFLWSFNITDKSILTGRILGINDSPIGDVSVSVNSDTTVRSDQNGRFLLYTRSGRVTVSFQKDGYDVKSITISLAPGEELDLGDIVLEETSRRWELFWILASVSIVSSGIIAFVLFMVRTQPSEPPEDEDELFQIDEDTDVLPDDFFDRS